MTNKATASGRPVRRSLTGYAAGPKAVGSFVPKLAQKSFEKFGFATAAVLTDWASIVGRELAACTAPDRLRWPRPAESEEAAPAKGRAQAKRTQAAMSRTGATLMLRVEPARALDVQYKTAQIIDRINAYFGYLAVTEIRLSQAPLAPKPQPRTGSVHGRAVIASPKAVLGKAMGRADTAGIEDAGLRLALERLGSAVDASPHRHG